MDAHEGAFEMGQASRAFKCVLRRLQTLNWDAVRECAPPEDLICQREREFEGEVNWIQHQL